MRVGLSTRTRLSLLAMVAVAPALAIADVVLLISLSNTESSEVERDLVAQASLLQASIDDNNGQLSFGPVGAGAGPVTVNAAVVSTAAVRVSVGTAPLPPAAVVSIAKSVGGSPVFADAGDIHGDPQRVYAAPLASSDQNANGVLVVSRSISALQASERQNLLLAILVSSLTLAVTGLIARWLAGRVLRPVRTIAALAQGISERDLHRRVEVTVPPDELGSLTATFNGMLSRLEMAFSGLQRFTADASHELRAPLAIMRAELELSLGRARDSAEYRQSQRRLLREVQHLSSIADRLLLLARSDDGTLRPEQTLNDVNDLLTETVERWQPAARKNDVTVSADIGTGTTVYADTALLRQVIDNLVDNAVRHSPPGSTVRLRAGFRGDGCEIQVADEGPGVPEDMRPLLFERFFRANAARTPGDSQGAGLGLAVAGAIARAHSGELRYLARGSGAVFQLWLPHRSGPATSSEPAAPLTVG